jgi:hypothetical protein
MRTLFFIASLAAILAGGVGCHQNYASKSPGVEPTDLSSQQWDNRMLLMFAPSQNDPKLQVQKEFLAGQEDRLGAAEVRPIQVIGNGPVRLGAGTSNDVQARNLRARFGVFDELFTIILVGKDGHVRLRSADPLTAQQVLRSVAAPPLDTPPSQAYGIAPRSSSGNLAED